MKALAMVRTLSLLETPLRRTCFFSRVFFRFRSLGSQISLFSERPAKVPADFRIDLLRDSGVFDCLSKSFAQEPLRGRFSESLIVFTTHLPISHLSILFHV